MKENKNITSKKGEPLTIMGEMIEIGRKAPEFKAVDSHGNTIKVSDFKGRVTIITAFPAIKTPVCSMQARKFNKIATSINKDIVVIGISKDDTADTHDFCIAEGIEGIHILSDKKWGEFGRKYGFDIKELGLLARGTVIIGPDGMVSYVEYVPDITHEPDYGKAMECAKNAALKKNIF